jgi:hypothetical protein
LKQIIDQVSAAEQSVEAETTEEDIPVITLDEAEPKRRPHHERYQKGERNTIIMIEDSDDESAPDGFAESDEIQ